MDHHNHESHGQSDESLVDHDENISNISIDNQNNSVDQPKSPPTLTNSNVSDSLQQHSSPNHHHTSEQDSIQNDSIQADFMPSDSIQTHNFKHEHDSEVSQQQQMAHHGHHHQHHLNSDSMEFSTDQMATDDHHHHHHVVDPEQLNHHSEDEICSPFAISPHLSRILSYVLRPEEMWTPSETILKDVDFNIIQFGDQQKDMLKQEVSDVGLNTGFDKTSLLVVAKILQSFINSYEDLQWHIQELDVWEEYIGNHLGLDLEEWKKFAKKVLRASQELEIYSQTQHHQQLQAAAQAQAQAQAQAAAQAQEEKHGIKGHHGKMGHKGGVKMEDKGQHSHHVNSNGVVVVSGAEQEELQDEDDLSMMMPNGVGHHNSMKRKRGDVEMEDLGDDSIVEEEGHLSLSNVRHGHKRNAMNGNVGMHQMGMNQMGGVGNNNNPMSVMGANQNVGNFGINQLADVATNNGYMNNGFPHHMNPGMMNGNNNNIRAQAAQQQQLMPFGANNRGMVPGSMSPGNMYDMDWRKKQGIDVNMNNQFMMGGNQGNMQGVMNPQMMGAGQMQVNGTPTKKGKGKKNSNGGGNGEEKRGRAIGGSGGASGGGQRKRSEGNFGLLEVTQLLTLPQSEAAKSLNMSNATFSKRFRIVQSQEERRWPYRQLQVIEKQLKDAIELNNAESMRHLQERKSKLLSPAYILMKK
eukprot:TRINITY_DN2184_c0_g1_i3.p1 TRINITY_DN2184_c0_g1~~TRINITY_DN2184_c0_g1_i3.p1  ORF type:complete len:690 (-),score=216.64 TRINITY_DN2184_c0_g1_i3:155-2224(-)